MFHFLNGAKWVGIFHKNKAAKVFKIISTTFKNTRPLICMSTRKRKCLMCYLRTKGANKGVRH